MSDGNAVVSDALRWRSSSATRCGIHHPVNEDALADIAEAGVFVVADGMGGHTDGAVASRSIVEVVQRRVAQMNGDLDESVGLVEDALRAVNNALRREAASRPGNVVIGSTVVVLVLDGAYAACLWAGDSRVYLLRDGHLYQLTRDHTLAAETGSDVAGGALTRAVGSAEPLMLDRLVTEVEPNDTFLVCSDGVTKVLSDEDIGAILADPIDGLAARIVARAVAKDAADDVSAIVVRLEGARP